MMHRRMFVHTLGAGAAGAWSWLESGTGAIPAARQNRPERAAVTPAAIRIGSNENPYGPAPSALDAARLAASEGHRYPGAVSSRLVDALAAVHQVPGECVLLSAGSGDLLRAACMAFTGPGRALVTGSPSYEQPVRQTRQSGAMVHEVPLTGKLELDLDAMLARAKGSGLLYICNPNNPTSTCVPASRVRAAIESLARTSPDTRVLVDEAYFEYAEDPAYDTLMPLVRQYPTVVVVRTFSKIHGMAGMRVGYAIAQETTLARLREFHSTSGMSNMSLAAATASLTDTEAIKKNQAMNRDTRRFVTRAFEKAGYRVAASQANFVMVDIRRDARGFADVCRQKGVAIGRPFPPLTTWARITIGTPDEMTRAWTVFEEVLEAPTTAASAGPIADESWC